MPKETNEPLPFDPSELLDILTADYIPCTRREHSDKEVTSADLALSIMEHSGEEIALSQVNAYMHDRSFHQFATESFGIVWLLKRR